MAKKISKRRQAIEEKLTPGQEHALGAALDVLPVEPPDSDDRIRAMGDNVLLSPHMVSANAPGTLEPAIPWATEAIIAALKGEVPDHVCNVDAIPLWLDRFGNRSLV